MVDHLGWIGDLVALYGAIVASLAIGIQYAQFRESQRQSSVVLEVLPRSIPIFVRNFGGDEDKHISTKIVVTVRNLGHIATTLESGWIAGHVDGGGDGILYKPLPMPESRDDRRIPPQSYLELDLALRPDELFYPVRAEVVDGAGKTWNSDPISTARPDSKGTGSR
ncbi:MAG: hypothetical protein H6748_21310 [Spirochaetaceae bacterium]|nr:hypothetical protein [Myxococcales bacterium]MCB9726599.1 hypothetical protein [Spirochaetaceae bacterium]